MSSCKRVAWFILLAGCAFEPMDPQREDEPSSPTGAPSVEATAPEAVGPEENVVPSASNPVLQMSRRTPKGPHPVPWAPEEDGDGDGDGTRVFGKRPSPKLSNVTGN